MRTARSRTSAENLFVVGLLIAPSSQDVEPPANPVRFKVDGQQATPQASKEPREGRSRRSEHSGAQPPARTPTAHSTGPVKVHGDPDRFSSPGGGCGSRRSLRGHRTVEEPDAVAAASGFTI